ncbi:hypothetical protein BVX95_02195 [archaeon D22]|nr:hypothetical protein BVX95_02195 [archaeon D22]
MSLDSDVKIILVDQAGRKFLSSIQLVDSYDSARYVPIEFSLGGSRMFMQEIDYDKIFSQVCHPNYAGMVIETSRHVQSNTIPGQRKEISNNTLAKVLKTYGDDDFPPIIGVTPDCCRHLQSRYAIDKLNGFDAIVKINSTSREQKNAIYQMLIHGRSKIDKENLFLFKGHEFSLPDEAERSRIRRPYSRANDLNS